MKRGTFGLVAVTALLMVGPAPAQAALLYQQTAGKVLSDDSESSAYVAPNDHYSNQGADDFVVPAGVSWTIDRIDVEGSTVGQGLANQMSIFLYANAGTLPGPEIFGQTAIVSTGKPDFVIPLTGAPALQPGRYWVSPQFSFGSLFQTNGSGREATSPAATSPPGVTRKTAPSETASSGLSVRSACRSWSRRAPTRYSPFTAPRRRLRLLNRLRGRRHPTP